MNLCSCSSGHRVYFPFWLFFCFIYFCCSVLKIMLYCIFRRISLLSKSYCSTVHFRRITSIYQPTYAHIISHKTLLKHFNTLQHSDMFRSCQIIIRELCSLLNLDYSIHNSIRIYKRGIVAAYHVVWKCVVEQCLGVRRMLSNKRLFLKHFKTLRHVSILSDRNMSECFKVF